MKIKLGIKLFLMVFIFSFVTAGCTKTQDTIATNTSPPVVETPSSKPENPPKPEETPPGTVVNPPETPASDKDFIFPDSEVKKLKGEDILGLQPEVLPFAYNEIFARRGYTFENKAYKDYFSKKAWYKPDANFKYESLTEIEYYNANLIKYFMSKSSITSEPPKPKVEVYKADTAVSIDLNGDGVNEKITYSAAKNELSINNNVIKLTLDSPAPSFTIADININDKFKEVLVSDYGPSDDYSTYYYTFDGNKVISMGKTEGLYEFGLKIDGSGTINARSRGQILQTWFFDKSFRLNNQHMLVEVLQELYSTNYDVFLKIPLKLYKNKGDRTPSLTVKDGQTMKITGTDDNAWCFLKAADGNTGWIQVNQFTVIVNNGLRATEVFEGLCYAD